jgi:5'-deoxynucleotidase YfbR-like HD superfamily hydrolase
MKHCIENYDAQIFDQSLSFDTGELIRFQAHEIGETILQVSQLVIDFASIERVPRYCPMKRENDAEHSFMLALAGIEVSSTYYPGLDSGLIGKLALVHDFPELKTGDIATFDITDEQLAQKHANEQAELDTLLDELPPHIADLLSIYEEQELPETIFLKHLDKLLPNAVNSAGAGLKVMKEDYGVDTAMQFRDKTETLEYRFKKMFNHPSHAPLHFAHRYLADKFAMQLPEY